MCTLHANSAREALVKMCTLPLLASENVSAAFVVPNVSVSVEWRSWPSVPVTWAGSVRLEAAVRSRPDRRFQSVQRGTVGVPVVVIMRAVVAAH
jgi:hypothetical protein